MRSHWITASAIAAAAHTALAAPQQLAFSAPSFSSLSRTSLDDALRSAWNGVQHSRPVGWAEEGVRKFTEVVDNAGSNCPSPLSSCRPDSSEMAGLHESLD